MAGALHVASCVASECLAAILQSLFGCLKPLILFFLGKLSLTLQLCLLSLSLALQFLFGGDTLLFTFLIFLLHPLYSLFLFDLCTLFICLTLALSFFLLIGNALLLLFKFELFLLHDLTISLVLFELFNALLLLNLLSFFL